jgi:hypothetical protein
VKLLFRLRLFMGRFERCSYCERRIRNHGQGLHYSLYAEDQVKREFGEDSWQFKGIYKHAMICKHCMPIR